MHLWVSPPRCDVAVQCPYCKINFKNVGTMGVPLRILARRCGAAFATALAFAAAFAFATAFAFAFGNVLATGGAGDARTIANRLVK